MVVHLMETHCDRYYVCPACPDDGSFFYLPGSLRTHVKSKHPEAEADIKGQVDEQVSYLMSKDVAVAPSVDKTRKGRRSRREEKRMRMPEEIPKGLYVVQQLKERRMMCLVCWKLLDNKMQLDEHWQEHLRE